MSRKKPKVGDICEVATPAGLAYFQFTHPHDSMGYLVRILPGLFDKRPQDLSKLAAQTELYFVFYPLSLALRAGQTQIVSNQPVPEFARPSPLMRWPGLRDAEGRVQFWKIIEASTPLTRETHRRTPAVEVLSPQQKKLSIDQMWSHSVMVDNLARGWTPERAEEFRLRDFAEAAARKELNQSGGRSSIQLMTHFLYFRLKTKTERAASELRSQGFSVEVRRDLSEKNWVAIAKRPRPRTGDEMDQLRKYLEAVASKFDGDYDGWEAAFGDCDNVNRLFDLLEPS